MARFETEVWSVRCFCVFQRRSIDLLFSSTGSSGER